MIDKEAKEMLTYNRHLKKAVLDVLFKDTDAFYIHCMPNPLLKIGKRGLIDNEISDGITLVFGPYSVRHLSWDDAFIYCDMQFTSWEQVSIPYECIIRMFDKPGQVIMQWAIMNDESTPSKPSQKTKKVVGKKGNSQVIEVDFKNKQA